MPMINTECPMLNNHQLKYGTNIANIYYNSLKFLSNNTDINKKTGGKKI